MKSTNQYDAMIIGAGMSGMYQLYCLRKLGCAVQVFEAGSDVGGTWYWNRYPGARFDSESYSYGFSFSQELLDEWQWSEHFSAQPETLRYLNYVADKFDLRKDIRFNSRVAKAIYHETGNFWEIVCEDGHKARARFLITALGPLSAPTMPNIEGIDRFQGESFHTGLWPHEPTDFSNKRVGIIGTGATGVQTIQEVAKTVGHFTIFQRSPNYCAPLNNSPIDEETQQRIHQTYSEIFEKCRQSQGGFVHVADRRSALEVTVEEREAFYEKLYAGSGFGIWMGNFYDTFLDEEANQTISEFVKKKIRERVNDPELAEKLCPQDHGFGTRRVPMETNYYEVYNQDNVLLVDLRETPIQRITAKGIQTSDQEYELDIIIYATGFDAVVGSFNRIDIRGRQGQTLKDKWSASPLTYLGLFVVGFPNMMTLVGPHNSATFCNIPRCIEQNVEWVTELLKYIRAHQYSYVEATPVAEKQWTAHVHEVSEKFLLAKTDSWFTGVNPNLPKRQKRTFMLYAGGVPKYREKCDEVAQNNYEGLVLH